LNSNNDNNSDDKRPLIDQIVAFGILFGTILIISLLLPFPISLAAIFGVFFLRSMYRRKLLMKSMSHMIEVATPSNFSSSSSNNNNSSSPRYFCLSCGAEHKEVVACPNALQT
jgi:hypothetical protein